MKRAGHKLTKRQRERLMCQSKLRHPDEATARANASIDCKIYGHRAMKVYRCDLCRGWHLSTQPAGLNGRVTQANTLTENK